MGIKMVRRHGRIYASINGVVSLRFAIQGAGGCVIYAPRPVQTTETMEAALEAMAAEMGDWYTTTKAADKLVETGVFNETPSTHDICLWARLGHLPGSMKITGKGGQGQGGQWRIPQSALEALAQRRRER